MAAPPSCQPRGSSTVPAFTNFLRYWDCYKVIKVGGPAAIVQPAIAEWNDALLPDSFPGLPRFAYASTGQDITVVVDGDGSGLYCGATDVLGARQVQLTLYVGGGAACPTNRADATTTLKHELGHVLGYQVGAHHTPPAYCSFYLPVDYTINGTVCQHEIEGVLSAYGFRPTPGEVDSFWTRPLVTGLVTVPSAPSVVVGDSQQVVVTQFTFRRQNNAPSVSVGGATFSWESKSPGIASVFPSGLVTGHAVGATRLVITNSGSVPSGYQLGARFGGWGHEVPVTVTGGSGFRVGAISGPGTPITSAGTYSLTATVLNAPNGTLTIQWQVAYSNAVLDTVVTAFGPNSYALQVPAGSYNIRVTATPRVGSNTGASLIRDYPVCTGQGGGDLAASEQPGAGTDAVGGC